jgi:hypothetical protein
MSNGPTSGEPIPFSVAFMGSFLKLLNSRYWDRRRFLEEEQKSKRNLLRCYAVISAAAASSEIPFFLRLGECRDVRPLSAFGQRDDYVAE